ncbi:hypothetical protein JCM4814A_01730 [Streptomyces phaeofaciens JCM 4814]|uniref:Uncharacterized protein n=1 Tax=Streptomyces phaeofaciens TaxID=68254 RepID=A0A918M246_9ACTN|nr:hypothetical protein GCM10010226_90380 [Streptomyces phaeofaciens]
MLVLTDLGWPAAAQYSRILLANPDIDHLSSFSTIRSRSPFLCEASRTDADPLMRLLPEAG